MRAVVFVVLCGLLQDTLQAKVAVFDHYGAENGLPNEPVTAITESRDGFIWVGTTSGVFLFDGHSFDRIDLSAVSSQTHVLSLFVDQDDGLWIGTKNNGLLFYANHGLRQVVHEGVTTVAAITQGPEQRVWVGSNLGLLVIEQNRLIKPTDPAVEQLSGQPISALTFLPDQQLAAGHIGGFYLVDFAEDAVEFIAFETAPSLRIHDLYADDQQKLWLATSKQLLRFDLASGQFIAVPELDRASRILSVVGDQDTVWVATIEGGLFNINTRDLNSSQHLYQKDFQHALREKNVMSLYRSRQGFLWVGGFSQGLSVLDLNLHAFGLQTNTTDSIYCARNPNIKSLARDPEGYFWLGSDYGLLRYHEDRCESIELGGEYADNEYTVYATRHAGDVVWVATSQGLVQYHQATGQTQRFNQGQATFFSHELGHNKLLLGTAAGLFELLIKERQLVPAVVPGDQFQNISFREYAVDHQGQVFLPTSKGLLYVTATGAIQKYTAANQLFADSDVINLQFSQQGEAFISVKNQGLYHQNADQQLLKHHRDEGIFSSTNLIEHVLIDETSNHIWMSSTRGLIRLDATTGQHHLFSGTADSKHLSLLNTAFKDHKGLMYFGGSSGFVGFDPADIVTDNRDTRVIIKDLYLMNELVKVNTTTASGFTLEQAMAETAHLDFAYQDKVIKFDFVALNYNNPQSVRYQYQLAPTAADWVTLQQGTRQLIFSDLKAGSYQLKIKATDLDGLWSDAVTQLSFAVRPPPWLSWQAYVLYACCLLLVVFLYVRSKVRAQEKINRYLSAEVTKKTRSILKQKQIVEDLMARKNEIFSNVSHEFRTPITLILGPIAALEKAEQDPAKKASFAMVTRNSKRLLRLVNQMLKLAHITEKTTHKKTIVNLRARLNMLTEPYLHTAAKQGIQLITTAFADVDVLVTEDAIETTVGNFLSNAIKYTAESGSITVGTHLHGDAVEVYVKDSGCGISADDLPHIFKRFKRSSQHQATPGVGIGLALVKEVAELNQASIACQSEVGKGSCFSITWPVHTEAAVEQPAAPQPSDSPTTTPVKQTEKETVLIIEDNQDMLTYIQQVLSDRFVCLVASSGKQGIALAIQQVPDIIICDVMMPEMDGFSVCRRLRAEMITSHIPLVILTALDEKSSRIQGWRENIDMYLNKPFDAEELNLLLRNVLNVRHILSDAKPIPNADNMYTDMPEIDQRFIQKLKTLFEAAYQQPEFSLSDMASHMLVNERQLQRKVNALLNRTPLAYLREFRLLKAAESLKKGYQVSVTSDTCGFKSVSYFSQLFKKQYGMTPKQYQQLKHQHKPL